ncbi:MAG: beta-galactosidase [Clostridia bacterium]|nr:beta-galactosidase [Clostridia bacterium]
MIKWIVENAALFLRRTEVKMDYRTEHPTPQFEREKWRCLNGVWDFEYDQGVSGEARGLHKPDAEYSLKINVPFCPESALSGIGNTDFINSVWYKRTVDISKDDLRNRVLLRFGAVDYEATVFVNGSEAFSHKGGYVGFSGDITDYLFEGENVITVRAIDDTRDRMIPSGKQCRWYRSSGCSYTRTTGIWQPVWLEFVPAARIIRTRYETDPESAVVNVTATVSGAGTLRAEAFYEGRPVGEAETVTAGDSAVLSIKLSERHLWEIGQGRLYDLVLTFGEDRVKSYFGLRSVALDGYRFLLNGKSVFQRTILDQGFYPDGIYTAPSDEQLEADIDRSMALGFNGARLHQKIFEERFLYHCDRKGYIVWGEFPSWGLEDNKSDTIYALLPEWLEEIARDFNHPAIIGWCPFNETDDDQFSDLVRTVYRVTKAVDPTRPVIDTSGYVHVETDIFDVHDYEQNPDTFREHYARFEKEGVITYAHSGAQEYPKGAPVFVSEFGGMTLAKGEKVWGYSRLNDEEQFYRNYEALVNVMLDNPCIMGFCYTQLTDVEQEVNGLYRYDRTPKYDADRIRAINSRRAAIEDL